MLGHHHKPSFFNPLYTMGLQSIFYLNYFLGGCPETFQIEDAL